MSHAAVQPKGSYIRQTLRFASLLLGIAIDPHLQLAASVYTISLLIGFILVGLLALIDFLCILKNDERTEAMYTANASFIVLSIFILSKANKQPLLELTSLMMDKHQRSPTFAHIADNLFGTVVRKYRAVVIATYLLVVLIPLVITVFSDVAPGNNKSLIFPSWYPWNMGSPIGYSFTMFVQLISVTCGYAIVAAVLACLFCSLVTIFTLMRMFEQQLLRVYAATPLSVSSPNNHCGTTRLPVTNDYRLHQTLAQLTEEHKFLLRFTNKVVKYFSICSIMVAEAAFVTSIFLISVFISISGEYLYKVKLITASFFVTVASFLYCYAGEVLYEVNQNIKDIIYNMPWYEQDVKMKKIFYTLLLLTQQKFELRAYKMSKVQLSFFLYQLRLTYSVIQVLNNS